MDWRKLDVNLERVVWTYNEANCDTEPRSDNEAFVNVSTGIRHWTEHASRQFMTVHGKTHLTILIKRRLQSRK